MARFHRSIFKTSKTSASRKRNSLAEPLEPRTMLTADPVISEFQAINASTVEDEDGDFSDWIEIRNSDAESIDLKGWYLTDDETNLTKWQFPDVSLESNSQILVFASSKDRVDPAQQLHANFKLAGDGEYLALVKPDGTTVSQDFGSKYPEQFEDQSYGLANELTTVQLFDQSATVNAFVPTSDALGASWTETQFNDAAWQSGTLPVGYEVLDPASSATETFDGQLSADWTTDLPVGSSATVEISGGNLNLTVPQGQDAKHDDRGLAPMVFRTVPGNGSSDFEITTKVSHGANERGTAGLVVYDAVSGLPAVQLEYTLGLTFGLRSGGNVQGSESSFGRSSYSLRLVRDNLGGTWTGYFKLQDGDDWVEVGTATDGVLGVPTVDDMRVGLIARTPTSTMNAQFSEFELQVAEERPVYGPLISTDIGASLNGVNSSAYLRIPFEVEGDASRFELMDLTTSYDDGFRAFLNGTEITAQNVPVVSTWNSAATSEFGAVNERIPIRQFNVANFRDALVDGTNVLAVHGMNVSAGDEDFFFDASMTAGDLVLSPQFFIDPTPGELNAIPAAPTPELVAQEGVFFGSTVIELTLPNDSDNFEIRYTIDGNDPTTNADLYEGPITLNESAMFQARTFDTSEQNPLAPSNPISGTFFALDEELRTRESDIPLVILDTIGQRLPGSSSTSLASTNVLAFEVDPATGIAKIEDGIVDYIGRGGVRDRGSSTAGQPKPNMAFETWGATGTDQDDDEDIGLLGFSPESDWVLHAPYNFDRALIRNQFTYAMSNTIGRWAPGTRAVEVYFNRGRDGVVTESDYGGVYVLMEKIKQGSGRVDIEAVPEDATTEPEVSGGYIWKIDRADPAEPGFSAGRQTLNWVYPKSPRSRTEAQKVTNEQEDWVQDYFNNFLAALESDELLDINHPDGYAKYVDVGAAVDHGWMNVLTYNVDALRLSAYLHKNQSGKIEYGPLWDCDRCMESTDDRDNNPLVWGDNFFTFQWWRQMFDDPNFWQAYIDRWTDVRRDVMSNAGIDKILDELADEVRGSAQRNIDKWRQRPRTTSAFASGKLDGTWEGEVEHLREWLHVRAEFMDSNFVQPPSLFINDAHIPVDANGIVVAPGTQVDVLGPIMELFDDTKLISGEPGETTARYMVPIDDSLGDDWAQPGFDDANWQSGPTGLGYDEGDDFTAMIKTEVIPKDVKEGATTILTRFEFDLTAADAQAIQNQIPVLRMKYDDGFVAYLNGTEVHRTALREDLAWDSRARSHRDSDGVLFEDFELTEFRNLFVEGNNVLAIRGINSSGGGNDMFLLPELVTRVVSIGANPVGNFYYTTDGTDPRGPDGNPTATAVLAKAGEPLTINQNTRITARNFDDVTDRGRTARIVETDWSGLTTQNIVVAATPLAITEINYNPLPATAAELEAMPGLTDEDFEFIEIYNQGNTTADLVGVELSDGVEFDFINSQQQLAAGERMVVVSNSAAFELRYGAGIPIAGEFTGSLNNNGEDIDLVDGAGEIIFSVNYADNDPWPVRADGAGATLELIDPGTSNDLASKYYRWRASSEVGGSPGVDGQGPVGVVINEVLANSSGELSDSIELYNPTNNEIAIGGWFLSDSADDLLKFQIPAGTSLPAGQYLTFNESDFNPAENQNGQTSFALSGDNGDSVWLVATDGAAVSTFVDDVHFRATADDTSLGRLPNGTGRLAPLSSKTFGAENGSHFVSNVVISEVNYNPGQPNQAALSVAPLLSNSDLEFVEITNATAQTVDLSRWRMRGGVDIGFDGGTMLDAGESAVVVRFNPDAPINVNRLAGFRAHYGIDASVQILGGYGGQLNNSDDRVTLLGPGEAAADRPNFIPRVQNDEILYDDLRPWANADGSGNSLQRTSLDSFGNDANSWVASSPTPGETLTDLPGDFDGNGVVDVDDVNALFVQIRSNEPDLGFDLTSDGNVDVADRDHLIQNVLGTNFGDADLDGTFGTRDLVAVFAAGEYEDAVAGNSTWQEGDWDGDGDFGTTDLVLAFQAGAFNAAAARTAPVDSLFAAAVDRELLEDDEDEDLIDDLAELRI